MQILQKRNIVFCTLTYQKTYGCIYFSEKIISFLT